MSPCKGRAGACAAGAGGGGPGGGTGAAACRAWGRRRGWPVAPSRRLQLGASRGGGRGGAPGWDCFPPLPPWEGEGALLSPAGQLGAAWDSQAAVNL